MAPYSTAILFGGLPDMMSKISMFSRECGNVVLPLQDVWRVGQVCRELSHCLFPNYNERFLHVSKISFLD
jgi:hypothetical protein